MHKTLILGALCALPACQSPSSPAAGGEVDAAAADVRTFAVVHDFDITVPDGAQQVDAWFALPDRNDPLQAVGDLQVDVEAPDGVQVEHREASDVEGNRFLYLRATGASGSTLSVTTTFTVERTEQRASTDPADTRPLTAAERTKFAKYLMEGRNVVVTPEIRKAAAAAVGDERNPMRMHRALYDWTLEHVQYWVKAPASLKSSGVGSSTYTFEECTGNCTDFHSLYAAAARSQGLPTRMVYGSFFKEPLDGVDKDQSYHCWIEFWAPEIGWVPLDVAVADLYLDDFRTDEANASLVSLTLADGYHGPDPARVDYYFGNLEARRVTWHRGRDLEIVDPVAPQAGKLNDLPKAHVEIDGVTSSEWSRKLTFHETD